MEQETYLERIKKLKSSRKITNDRLAEMTGIPLGTLSKLLAGISDSPKLSNIVAISRALDCSLDWLITGVPENTNNYTLEPEEITLVETWRELDGFGRDLTLALIRMERDRTERQTDETRILLHEAARHTARRTGRARRAEDGEGSVAGAAVSVGEVLRPVGAMPAMASSSADATLVQTTAMAEQTADASGAKTATAEEKTATVLSVPRSTMDRTPAGLRRRSIGLYDMPVSAGVGEFLDDTSRTDIVIPDDPRTAEADFALRINGDSMEPKYHSGDILLIQSAESVEEGELGIFVLDGSGYFKKFGGDHLISLNPAYPPIRLKDFQEIACCGRIVGKLKKK